MLQADYVNGKVRIDDYLFPEINLPEFPT